VSPADKRPAPASEDADRAADRRFAVAVAFLVVVEVILAGLADAGTIGLVVWLVLTVAAVGAAAVLARLLA
jgi:hypothetical protein